MASQRAHEDIQGHRSAASRAPELDRELESELVRRCRAGDEKAKGELVRSHLRYVVGMATKYRHYGVPLSELIAEGNYGVVQALSKFEPDRGVRFMTYAAYWVRACMWDHVIKSWSMVGGGLGALRSSLFFRLRRERVRAINLMGEGEAADRLVAERVGIRPEALGKLLQQLDARDVSLDAKIHDESASSLLDLLPAPDNQELSLYEGEVDGNLKKAVAQALAELDPRERYIAQRRLMADAGEELSLSEIGRRLGVSRERVRQLEARTKRKLKHRIGSLSSAAVLEWLEHTIKAAPAA
jgi:RNA polymerase sigma-32 factor